MKLPDEAEQRILEIAAQYSKQTKEQIQAIEGIQKRYGELLVVCEQLYYIALSAEPDLSGELVERSDRVHEVIGKAKEVLQANGIILDIQEGDTQVTH